MYDVLLFLVGVHAQVNSVARPLLDRSLHALVEDVAREALECFTKIEKFGMGGMLRVSLVRENARNVYCVRRRDRLLILAV